MQMRSVGVDIDEVPQLGALLRARVAFRNCMRLTII